MATPTITEAVDPNAMLDKTNLQKTDGSLSGRFIRWLNNSADGQLLQGVTKVVGAGLCAVLAVGFVAAAAFLVVASVFAMMSLVGIPFGIAGIAVACGLLCNNIAVDMMKSCWKSAMENFDKMKAMSQVNA